MTRDRTITATVWLFILIWIAVWSGITIVGAVALLGWLIATTVDAIVGFAMWVSGT